MNLITASPAKCGDGCTIEGPSGIVMVIILIIGIVLILAGRRRLR